ncbi:MAG: sporulation protein YqfD [Acutalibacter sp.]|jgi:similar to stage IV sporulation protein
MNVVNWLIHYLTGWVEFEIRGGGARFLNAAAKSGVEFWGFTRQGDRMVVRGRPWEYKRLRPLFRRCGAHPHILRRKGVPFLMARAWKRKGLVLGAVCGVGIYLFLSGFCWGVTVTGTETLTHRQVLEAAANCGVRMGVRMSSFDPKEAALSLQNQLPQATWLSVNTDGCFVEVALREVLSAPEVVDEQEWSNMVASRAGTVISINAERGRPEVEVGETVEPGQLLIAGLYQQEVDPWSPPPEKPYQVLGAARGSVRALTYREFSVEVPQERTVLVPGETHTQRTLEVFGFRLPLGLYSAQEGECRTWKSTTAWSPLGRALPLVWESTVIQPLREEKVLLEEADWKEAALLELRRQQREELPAGSCVVKEDLSYQMEDGVCRLKAVCRCEEEIGEVRKISFE